MLKDKWEIERNELNGKMRVYTKALRNKTEDIRYKKWSKMKLKNKKTKILFSSTPTLYTLAHGVCEIVCTIVCRGCLNIQSKKINMEKNFIFFFCILMLRNRKTYKIK